MDPPAPTRDYRSDAQVRDSTVVIPKAYIFFPPSPPPLDVPIFRTDPSSKDRPLHPAGLSSDANEIFYAPLATRLFQHELSAKLHRRLAAYRTARADLLYELQQELARVRPADADTRRRALASLANRQAARLVALEVTAEELRADLIDAHYSWFGQREWHLGSGPRSDRLDEVAAAMRGYAFFREGLLPAQRRLLREIVIEIEEARQGTQPAAPGQRYVFFSPETARVQLPADLPAPLAARVSEYQSKKSELKKELYDGVHEQEKAFFLRGNTLKGLATAQADRLVALEKLAEEIRLGLVTLSLPVPPAYRPPLPPVLTARVAALLRQRTALQAATQVKIEEINRRAQAGNPPIAVDYSFQAENLAFDVMPPSKNRLGGLNDVQRRMDEINRAMTTVTEDFKRDFAQTTAELNAIRGEIALTPIVPGHPKPEAALAAAINFSLLQESVDGYRDYRTAVFEPGLSPEQRRLLFGHAIAELNLPPSPGTLQPTSRGW